LLAITTLTLAYVTLADNNDNSSYSSSSSSSEPAFKLPDLIPDALKPESFRQDGGKKTRTKHDIKSKKTHKRR
jgi:hypothetical protein